jgi:hypothetical protein
MPKNKKVKGFCAHPGCGDPVITGGKHYNGKWYHNPCFIANSYGIPNRNPGQTPRRSAPPYQEIKQITAGEDFEPEMDNSGEEMDLRYNTNPLDNLQVLAHAKNVTLAANPTNRGKQMFYVYQGPADRATNIVRMRSYPQANQYYKDVVDGKMGLSHNPLSRTTKIGMIVLGVAIVGVIAFYIWKRRRDGLTKNRAPSVADAPSSQGTGSPSPGDGFGGVK